MLDNITKMFVMKRLVSRTHDYVIDKKLKPTLLRASTTLLHKFKKNIAVKIEPSELFIFYFDYIVNE